MANEITGIASLTTTQRNALTDLFPGLEIYNSTVGLFEIYNGALWVPSIRMNVDNGYDLDRGSTTKLTAFFKELTTTNATPTSIFTYTMDVNSLAKTYVSVFAAATDYSAGYFGEKICAFRRQAGNAVRIGVANGIAATAHDFVTAAPNITFDVSSSALIINVVGILATTIKWSIYLELSINKQ